MLKSMKRMVLTGAALLLMMSFAAPAIAQQDLSHSPDSSTYGDTEEDSGGIAPLDRLAFFMDEWL